MLYTYLKSALLWLAMLFIPPPEKARRVDANAPCPACGNDNGELAFERVTAANTGLRNTPMVKHTCLICNFAWYEYPVGVPEFPAL